MARKQKPQAADTTPPPQAAPRRRRARPQPHAGPDAGGAGAAGTAANAAAGATTAPAPPEAGAKKRDRMAFDPGDDLAERIRNYVYWTPGANVNGFLVEAARKEMDRLEQELNDGKPWPPRHGPLKTG